MKIAYISHHKRPNYEYSWISGIEAESVKILDTDFSSYPENTKKNVELCKVDFTQNPVYNKIFHSTALIVNYQHFESYLSDVDVIVVLEVFSSLSKQFVEYAKKTGKKVVVLVYELISEHPIYKIFPYNQYKKYCLKNADLFVCVSNKAKEHLVKLGADPKKTEVIYPGIDMTKFNTSIKPIKPKKDKRLIFVGRLDRHKGIDMVLAAFEKCVVSEPDLELWIIGGGQYEQEVRDFTKKYKSVKYFGKIPNDQIGAYLNSAGIYILPCRDTYKWGFKIGSEQFGFSFVEAMACGLAVISTKCGAIPEVVTSNNICTEQDSVDELTSSILELAKSKTLHKTQLKNIEISSREYNLGSQTKLLKEKIEQVIQR